MIHVYVVSAFSKDGGGGNRAGVVLDRPELTPAQKMAAAAALGYSETAFVTASDRADWKIEYFTPTEEVPLCGHATIASFTLLHRLGRLSAGEFMMETKAGLLRMAVSGEGTVRMEQNRPVYGEVLAVQELAGCVEAGSHRSPRAGGVHRTAGHSAPHGLPEGAGSAGAGSEDHEGPEPGSGCHRRPCLRPVGGGGNLRLLPELCPSGGDRRGGGHRHLQLCAGLLSGGPWDAAGSVRL